MSMKAVTLVEERSRAKGSNLAALRSIADFANDRGQGAFPSPSTIAWKNRLTVRAAELIVRKLVEDGEVQPEWDAASRRLYLHVRCICDWEAYQAEGPIPLREIFSRSVRSDFAERLVELAKNRATEVSSHDSTTEKSCTTTEEFCSLSEKSCVENDASASSDGTSRSYPSDPLNDPSTDPVREGSATPSQLAPAAEPAPATEPPSATKPEIPLESSTAITRIDLEGFQADWNAEAQRSHLPRCTELTKRRRRLMRAALTER
ncbi:MAG TPA: hypothetical protein VFA59_16910, partial [Vicinamibacterales bacterium]|nr:hypothetical protein [Vicinamibacterales bacterium]